MSAPIGGFLDQQGLDHLDRLPTLRLRGRRARSSMSAPPPPPHPVCGPTDPTRCASRPASPPPGTDPCSLGLPHRSPAHTPRAAGPPQHRSRPDQPARVTTLNKHEGSPFASTKSTRRSPASEAKGALTKYRRTVAPPPAD